MPKAHCTQDYKCIKYIRDNEKIKGNSMSSDEEKGSIQLIIDRNSEPGNFGVILPCEPSSFGDFISKLLGKPQTIEKQLFGSFKIDKDDLINTHYIIDQRINQQNESTFIQFSAKMYFSDNSSVEINTLEDLLAYQEIKKVNCTLLNMSWIYLIKFKNKATPEKQQINITFGDISNSEYFIRYISHINGHFKTSSNLITLTIQHTERTWGVDIESLLNNHLMNFKDTKNTYRNFIYKHSSKIGLMTASVLFGCSTAGAMYTIRRLTKTYNNEILKITRETSIEALQSKKIDFLLEMATSGAWPKFILSLVFFMVIALVVSLAANTWVSYRAQSRQQSWILITESSKEEHKEYTKKIDKSMALFALSIIVSIGSGIIGNILFSLYFSNIL